MSDSIRIVQTITPTASTTPTAMSFSAKPPAGCGARLQLIFGPNRAANVTLAISSGGPNVTIPLDAGGTLDNYSSPVFDVDTLPLFISVASGTQALSVTLVEVL